MGRGLPPPETQSKYKENKRKEKKKSKMRRTLLEKFIHCISNVESLSQITFPKIFFEIGNSALETKNESIIIIFDKRCLRNRAP